MCFEKKVTIEDIFRHKRVWIYGIGVVGKRICQIFHYFGIKIKGILVSSMKGNIDNYMNIPVMEFKGGKYDKDDLILVTATGKAKEEICSNLALEGIDYVVWTSYLLNSLWKKCDFKFINRIKGKEKVCIVLSGYKDFLWDDVYDRLKKFIPDDVEVCLCSAGKTSEELCRIAESNDWSYLSTSVNSVSLIQNVSISLYESAKWIYKMDEDMFVTHNVFENMYDMAQRIIKSGKYDFGICSPVVPVNAIGYRYVLEKYNKLQEYEELFGKAYIGGASHREIEKNAETAKFMWGSGGMPKLDIIANDFSKENDYRIVSTRLSIGFVLFQRELWERMQGFLVFGNMDLGVDEEDLMAFCINDSKVISIAMNSVVGHFGFGNQTKAMKEYYKENKEKFACC